jgi:hypothetical protein
VGGGASAHVWNDPPVRQIGGTRDCLMAAFIALALALTMPAIAPASPKTVVQKPEEQVVLKLPVKHGYRAAIIDYPLEGVTLVEVEKGAPDRRHGRWSGAAFAVQTAPGSAEGGIYAGFGAIGTVSGSIEVSGPGEKEAEFSPQEGCRGKQPLYFDASFNGTIAIRVKGGFFRVNTSQAKGYVYRSYELKCEKGKAGHPSRDPSEPFSYLSRPAQSFTNLENPILFSSLHHRHRWIEMAASTEANHEQLSSFRAEAVEWLPGDVATVRWAAANRVASEFIAFGAGDPPRSATLEPPAPFSGTARFTRRSHSLLGDLAVQLPGGLRVRVGSRASQARVCDLNLRRNTCR